MLGDHGAFSAGRGAVDEVEDGGGRIQAHGELVAAPEPRQTGGSSAVLHLRVEAEQHLEIGRRHGLVKTRALRVGGESRVLRRVRSGRTGSDPEARRLLVHAPRFCVGLQTRYEIDEQIRPPVANVPCRRLLLTGEHLDERAVLLLRGWRNQPIMEVAHVHEFQVQLSPRRPRDVRLGVVPPAVTSVLGPIDDSLELFDRDRAILDPLVVALQRELLLDLLEMPLIVSAGKGEFCQPLDLGFLLLGSDHVLLNTDGSKVSDKGHSRSPPLPLGLLKSTPGILAVLHKIAIDTEEFPAWHDAKSLGLSSNLRDNQSVPR
mmetsp:Transcript_78623/g.141832  ORF Transcript_78623/g.141832 Transcript_78623/m.141832 type:complete len:318 (+) Transcript_78623:957-1910(+)